MAQITGKPVLQNTKQKQKVRRQDKANNNIFSFKYSSKKILVNNALIIKCDINQNDFTYFQLFFFRPDYSSLSVLVRVISLKKFRISHYAII